VSESLEQLAARVGLEPMLTLDELALLAKASRRSIERAVAAKRLRVVHLSPRMVRVPLSSATAFLDGVEERDLGAAGATVRDLPKLPTRRQP